MPRTICHIGIVRTPPPATSLKNIPLSPAERRELLWLPPAATAQKQVFDYLQAKVGHKIYRPEPPDGGVYTGQWFGIRQPFSHDPAVVYPNIYEDLLVAKKLLNGTDPEGQRLGLVIARYSNLWLRQNLNDTTLSPRIMEAFLLPNLTLAYPESWHEVSRREILEDSNDAYRDAKESDHQIAILKYMIHFGHGANFTDWARLQLGEVYAAQGKYDLAIASVNAITDDGMSGAKLLIPDWKIQAAKQSTLQQQSKSQATTSQRKSPH